MYQDNRQFDFHPIGREIKRKREAKGWTQDYLVQLVDRTPRSIMYVENRGQHPSLNIFFKIVTLDGVVNKRGAKWQYNEFGQQRRRKRHFWRSA